MQQGRRAWAQPTRQPSTSMNVASDREAASSNSRGGGNGGGGAERFVSEGDGSAPSSGSATSGAVPSSAPTPTTATKKSTTMATKPTTDAASKRSSSTESDSRREYDSKDRRRRSQANEEEDGEEDDNEEEEEEEEEEDGRRGSESTNGEVASGAGGGGGGGGAAATAGGGVGGGSDGDSSSGGGGAPHPSHASSSTSGSPVRRLPPMLRAPSAASSQQQQQAIASMYDHPNTARQPLSHYYGAASPRDASPSPGGMLDGGRMLAQKRRLQQQSNEYMVPSSPSLPPSVMPSQQQQHQSLGQAVARAMYDHHPSSNSSSSTARSAGGAGGPGLGLNSNSHSHAHQSTNNSHAGHHRSAMDDDDDDDNEDPLRFETRGSHGPRDEARYETWTSKQLRKKCSHLKLRGLKNVKKHVMVEALYRYYRNQRGKAGEGGGGGDNGGGGASNSGGHLRSSNSSVAHSTNSGGRAVSSMRNEDNALYADAYSQSQHRYDHSMNAASGNSGYISNSGAMGMRGSRPTMGSGNPSPSLNTNHQAHGRRSSPSSLTPQSRQTMRHPSGASSLPGGGYNSTIDLEESKYDSLDNEVRITSEDVIRLVDVILSPEFVDRLASELSRWQFWVDVREKYISLAAMNGPSSYGAARGLTALGGDHHTQPSERDGGGSNSVDNLRFPVTSTYRRPSAKWSSMQLWEMWKELTFAYTKTCFEFTAAGMRSVDERNYIQFCEGRPDVYYLHQRLHARPDLLHLIKSNEYIEEKCSSDATSEHANMSAEKNAANALMGVGSPVTQPRPHKRFKRIVPAGSNGGDLQGASGVVGAASGQTYGIGSATTANYGNAPSGSESSGARASVACAAPGGNAGVNANASGPDGATPSQIAAGKNNGRPSGSSGASGRSGGGGGPAQYIGSNGMRVGTNGQQEEGSTENSETTGEEGSLEKSNSNATSSDSARREALAEQKYFGLLLQNFEAIFESLHNKKVLLAALRKDNSAPDHLIADLHDDIHVLSALKKDFRNKLRQALE